jgi:glycosyltransferase involved in cell wall biosynthesis
VNLPASRSASRILHASYDAPGWGGAATTAYALFDRRQRDGADVHFVNLVAAREAAVLRDAVGPEFDNPRRLADVHTCGLDGNWWGPRDELIALVERLRPDAILAHGFLATGLMRFAAPRVPLIFYTTGSRRLKTLLQDGALRDFDDFQRLTARGVRFLVPPDDQERRAVEASDLIVLHSPHVRVAYEHFYPGYMGKVYDHVVSVADFVHDEAAAFRGLARPFAERDIDVVAVASDWRRVEKNYPLVRHVAMSCPDLRVSLVGLSEPDDAPLQRHGIVSREALFALLGRAKVLICPSTFDAAPGVLFEAAALGCNIVASPNCGNWTLCNEQLVARSPAEFVARTRHATKAPLPANPEPFLGGYADLVETLEAFVAR